MSRDQFFEKLETLDEAGLRKALWNLYWRGSATTRERIEAEIEPATGDGRKRRQKEPVSPEIVLNEVAEFVALARSGAYMAGDRRVSPRERTRWRFTFRRLVNDACAALRVQDAVSGEEAIEQLIDLASEMRGYDYFHSEDPVEAARIVVSDLVSLLWGTVRDRYGFREFARRAAPQLIRWESRYGWTRSGYGPISEKETTLADVIASMLPIPDAWTEFADHYLGALDQFRDAEPVRPARIWPPSDYARTRRAEELAEWHSMLFRKLIDFEAFDDLERLAHHPALGGPELALLQARLAHQRGDLDGARTLVHESLQKLPGHHNLLGFAAEIGAPLPPRAQQLVDERSGLP